MEAKEATAGQTLSGPPCHALREKPEEDNESTGMTIVWLGIRLAVFLWDNVGENAFIFTIF